MVNQILVLNFSDVWSFRLYGQLYQDKTVDHISETRCTVRVDSLPHSKWIETKQHPCMFPGPTVPGGCLVSFHFLLGQTIYAHCSSQTMDINHLSEVSHISLGGSFSPTVSAPQLFQNPGIKPWSFSVRRWVKPHLSWNLHGVCLSLDIPISK